VGILFLFPAAETDDLGFSGPSQTIQLKTNDVD